MRVGNCIVHEDFQVLDFSSDSNRLLILRRAFMATVGEIVYMVETMISFTHIDKNVHYEAVSEI